MAKNVLAHVAPEITLKLDGNHKHPGLGMD
jgi:hypothetical protein